MEQINAMASPTISTITPPVVSTIDAMAGVTAIGGATNNAAIPPVESIDNRASVVELSAGARILSTAAGALENAARNALAFEETVAQLAARVMAAEAQLNQDATVVEQAALTSAATNSIDNTLQSTLADVALNEAIAATGTTAATAPLPQTEPVAASAAIPTANVAVAESPPTTAIAPQVTTVVAPITDPAVAAAIAAYRLGDGLLSEKEALPEEIPLESDIDITPTSALHGSKLDLHDSARDDALNGSAWNWMWVNPVQRRFTRR